MTEECEVVISGMCGRFPNCKNLDELKQSLFDGINLVSDEGRWKASEMDVPHQVGAIKDPYAFDLTYFGVARKVAEFMDPNTKNIMECAVAAVHDAGLSLSDIAGSNTATIASSTLHETERDISSSSPRKLSILMYANCMQANRIAYFMDLRGPSYVCLSDWNGGLYVLQHARKLIATGLVKAAVVATSTSIFQPHITYHFHRLGRINDDGKTKSFSNDADGYSRSEASVVFFLQKKEDALRTYGTLLGVKVSPHGSKLGSCADCSQPAPSVVKSVYETAKVDPSSVSYLEATGCASKVVDAEELNSISDIFLSNRKGPLLIGSVKSNLGHTEAAASFVGIVKMLLAAETGLIPPNIHYSTPNKNVPALLSGQLKVVTEPIPLEGDFLAINNLSAFGSHGHALIKRNTKSKQRQCQVNVLPPDGLPRLVLLSGRNEEQLNKVIDKVEQMPIDEEFIALTHRTFGKGIKNHMYRGFTVLHEGTRSNQHRLVQPFAAGESRRPLWVVFSGMGSQWPAMGAKLMIYPPFAKAIKFCHSILQPMGVDLIDILTNPDPETFKDILKCFVGITSIQIGLVDLLKEIGIEADGIVGHSLGEVGCSYFDGSLTAQQAIMGSYLRGKISAESKMSGGLMAAVGKGYNQLKDILPDGIDIACRNSSTSCTISGPAELVQEFMESLLKEGVFVRAVPSGNIAYHSRYIQHFGKLFLESYKKVVPNPKPRSSKWISSSVPEEKWDTELAKYSSAEYHAHNLLNPVLFEEAMEHIPKEAIIIEVAPRGLLKAIVQRAIPSATYVSLCNIGDEGDITLLAALGRLFNEGVSFDIEKLYPPVEFPVSRGTPSLSPLFTWLRQENFKKWAFLDKQSILLTRRKLFFNNENLNKINYRGLKINETPIVPVAAYLDLTIDMFKEAIKKPVTRIVFENITFGENVKYGALETKPVIAALQADIGHWEFTFKSKGVATGNIELYYPKVGSPFEKIKPPHLPIETLSGEKVYSILAEMGLAVNKECRNIQSLSISEYNSSVCADILWKNDWLAFLDSIVMIMTFFNSLKNNKLLLVKKIRQLFIDFDAFKLETNQVLKVYYNSNIELLWTDGLELHLPLMEKPKFESFVTKKFDFLASKFVPFERIHINETLNEFYGVCVRTIISDMSMGNEEMRKLHVFFRSEDIKVQEVFFEIVKSCNTKVALSSLPNDDALVCAKSIDMKERHCLIINENHEIEKTLAVLQRSEAGFLLCKGETFHPNLVLIMKKKLGNDSYFFYKTVNTSKEQNASTYVLLTSQEWEMELKDKLASKNHNIVYLVGPCVSAHETHQIVKRCSSLQHFKKIRLVFLDDCSSFKPELHEKQLNKDLKINVLNGDMWGTYIDQPLNLLQSSEIMSYNREFLYSFNSIKTDDIHLRALGLNIADLTVEETKFGVFEFSGTKNGKEVCGLASLNEKTRMLEVDPELVWEKPANWSHEDIVTSLLVYAMAYHMLNLEINALYLKSIFVAHGQLPLCQAIIRLALKRGYQVYTTYDGELHEKKSLLALFPEIPEDNVFKLDMCLYFNIMQRTNGKGVQVAINIEENERLLEPTAKVLMSQVYNKMYQLTRKPTKPGQIIGMTCFLKNIHMKGFGANCFLRLPKDEKKFIWDLISNGFRNDEIKPISKTVIQSTTFNVDAISQMKKDSKSSKKFVVSMNEGFTINELKNGRFSFEGEKLCIIIGSENACFFDLVQWHISRGCKKFIIAADDISTVLMKRLSVLINQNEHVHLNLCSSEPFNTPELASSFIKLVQQTEEIETLFVFGKQYCDVLGDVVKSIHRAKVVFIGKDLKVKTNGPGAWNHLAIKVHSDETDLTPMIENLDSLLKLSNSILVLNEYSTSNSGIETVYMKHWEHIPVSDRAIAQIGVASRSVRWKEKRTSTPSYIHCKDVPPVFIIPPLKKGQFDRLIRQLYFPAFEAVIPDNFKTFDGLAQELYKELNKFNTGVVTLICADWSYHLGLALGRILEENGKEICLILLDISNPWADLGVLNSIHSKISKSLESSNSNLKKLLENGFKTLKHRINTVLSSSIQSTPQLEGFCHVISNEHDEIPLSKLKQLCRHPVKVHSLNEKDYTKMINSQELAKLINSSVIIEHKDRARKISRDYNNIEPKRSG